ncbi:MAG TPA: site-specific integrase [Chloroflexota bacterium]|nr:site-specific integrase [Chloroflexota bacterium]
MGCESRGSLQGSAVSRYLRRLEAGSRRTQRAALDQIAALISDGASSADDLSWHLLTEQDTDTLRRQLAERYVPATANRMLAALRGVLKEAWLLGLMDAERYYRASNIANLPRSRPPRGRVLAGIELRALFGACLGDPTPAGARDAALLTVLYAGGLRRSEASALDVRDYDAPSGALTIRGTNDARTRTLYAFDDAAAVLNRWIRYRGEAPSPLFVPIDKAGRILVRDERMREQSIYRALLKRAEQAGVERFSCHDLRRTFITRLLESGADISTVQRLAGHCSIATTQLYDRRTEASRRDLARMLTVPGSGPRFLPLPKRAGGKGPHRRSVQSPQ